MTEDMTTNSTPLLDLFNNFFFQDIFRYDCVSIERNSDSLNKIQEHTYKIFEITV